MRRHAFSFVSLALAFALSSRAFGAAPQSLEAIQEENARLQKQVMSIELKMEEYRASIPDVGDSAVADTKDMLRERAKRAELEATIAIGDPVDEPLSNGQPSPIVLYPVDVTGRGEYVAFHRFLQSFAHSTAFGVFGGIERLSLVAAGSDNVTFNARLVRAAWRGVAATPTVPASPSPDPRTAAAARINTALRERYNSLTGTIKRLASLDDRYSAGRVVDALAALNDKGYGEAVALTRIDVKENVTIDGVTLGSATPDVFGRILSDSGFKVTSAEHSPLGTCRAFKLTGSLEKIEANDSVPIFNGLFDATASSICGGGPQVSASRIVVPAAGGDQRMTLHARGVDLIDVFRILNDIGAGNFVVDEDVASRVSIDADGAMPAGIIAAVTKSEGLAISDRALRRVRRATSPARPPREQTLNGEPITVTVKAADIADLLCALHETITLKPFVVKTGRPHVNVFASDVPWDGVLEGMFSSAATSYKIDGDRLYVFPVGAERAVASAPACETNTYRRTWWRIHPTKLDPSLLDLVAIASSGTKRIAYAYVPGDPRLLMAFRSGDAVGESRIGTITAESVTFDSSQTPMTLRLPK